MMTRSAFIASVTLVAIATLGFVSFETALPPQTDSYSVDKVHSAVSFKVRHLGISNVRGEFTDFDAQVSFDAQDLSTVQVSAVIQASSVDTGNDRRDDDLRSANFFDVDTYPTLSFESIRVENLDGDEFDLVGNLTMHGVTKEVVLEVEYLGQSGDKAGFTAETTVLRKDFGLTWDRITEAGSVVVANEVTITIDLELNRQ